MLLPRLLLNKYQGKHEGEKGVDDICSLTFFHVFVYDVVFTSLYVLSVFRTYIESTKRLRNKSVTT